MAEAARLLREHGSEARVLAGGHSLIPMMKLRLAAPEHLVDLAGHRRAARHRPKRPTASVIGAMTTQAELIADDALAAAVPLLREAALQIADPQVRNVGTIGGNVANGDPGNDMPAIMQCLGASFELAGPGGERSVAARDFYQGAFATACGDDEILVRDPGAGAARRPRRRLRQAEAQDRRLRDRRRRGGADASPAGAAPPPRWR